MKPLIVALYVLARAVHHKRRYDLRVARLLAQRSPGSYFFRTAVRDKTVGNQLGIEAWIVNLTGELPTSPELPFLLGAISTCYDNAVDEEACRDWELLEAVVRGGYGPPPGDPARSAFEAFRVLMGAFERAHPEVHRRLLPHLLAVHAATREGFKLGLVDDPDEERLRDVAYRKGGHSMLAFSLLAVTELSPELERLAFRLGAANQLADDIYDRREDEALGVATPARLRRMADEDRQLLLTAAESLPEGGRLLTRALKHAWRVHHREALAFYQSGRDTATPFSSVGQKAFEMAIRMVPPARRPTS